jgi:hypothetical protein
MPYKKGAESTMLTALILKRQLQIRLKTYIIESTKSNIFFNIGSI